MKAILLPTLVALALVGCSSEQHSESAASATEPKQVKTAPVVAEPSTSQIEYVGAVIPKNRAVIQSKVQAWVRRIPVTLGSKVGKGDLLIDLDSRDFAARVEQAKAANDVAAKELTRYTELIAKQVVSQQEFDAVKARADIAQASLAEAEATLSYARIVAPFVGTITQRMIDAGDMAQVGSYLLTIEEDGPLLFSAMLPESRLGNEKVGDAVTVLLPSIDATLSATVAEAASSVDPISHTFEIRVKLPESAHVRAGMFGRLQLPDANEQALWIPKAALVKRGQLDLVYAVTDDKRASLRLIRIGRETADRLEVLAGLTEAEQVVIEGQTFLSDNDPIEEMQ